MKASTPRTRETGALTAEDRSAFSAAVGAFGAMPARAIADGLALVRVRAVAKGAHLLVGGTRRATEVIFVVRGILREYFPLEDGTERTKAFVTEKRIAGSLADLLSDGPSRASIVAETAARVLVVPYAATQELGRRHEAWAELGRRTTAALLASKAEREWELLALDAAGRYEAFRSRYPGLETRVAAKNVASYIGITPVHLSRLRRRRRAAGRAR